MAKRGVKIRKTEIKSKDNHDDLSNTSPAARFGMVWPLTLNAWSFKEGRFAEPRLQRHLVRIYRRAR
jgi:hypothetical protein